MSKLRKALTIAGVTALTTFSVAACGGDSGSGGSGSSGGGGGGGEINVSMTSFPDYVDPQLSYTLEGWEVMYNTYTPLLTYKHAKGEDGTEVVPGLAKDMPEVSADGKTYKLTLRPNMKYSDGTPIKASDFTYAIQRLFKADSGGSVFYEPIVGASDYADGKADKISRHHHRRRHRRHHHPAHRGQRHLRQACSPCRSPRPFRPPRRWTRTRPTIRRRPADPFMITKVEAPQTLTMERNPNFKTVKDAGATEVADAQVDKITVTQNKSNSAQVTGVEQNTIDFMTDPPDADRLAEVKAKFADSLPHGGVDQHLLLLDEHPDRSVQRHQGPPGDQLRHRPRGAQSGVRRPPAPDAADPAAGHARLRRVQALPRTGHGEGESADRRGQSGRQGHHRLDRRRAGPQAHRRVLPRRAHPAGLQRHAQGHRGRRLLHHDRQPVDTRPGHRLR